jgi:hypothetical protein
MKVMVWYFMNDIHKVMTSIHFRDVGFGFVDTKRYFEQIIVEFSLQSHKYGH